MIYGYLRSNLESLIVISHQITRSSDTIFSPYLGIPEIELELESDGQSCNHYQQFWNIMGRRFRKFEISNLYTKKVAATVGIFQSMVRYDIVVDTTRLNA